ncbi:hypothetical protein CGJ07_06230 [Vibrio parahaemolyticus]|nr:hypothetical protein CGJ07_06230 [Vibrio parahaemolyticus]
MLLLTPIGAHLAFFALLLSFLLNFSMVFTKVRITGYLAFRTGILLLIRTIFVSKLHIKKQINTRAT